MDAFDRSSIQPQEQPARVTVVPSIPVRPASAYADFASPYPILSEDRLLRKLQETRAHTRHIDGEFTELLLEDFSIYTKWKTESILASLEELSVKQGRKTFFLDGTVDVHGARYRLEHVPFSAISIGGYEDTGIHTACTEIWIRSLADSGESFYYKLGSPAIEYTAYHHHFSWLADLSKHVVDFLQEHENISLRHFDSDFAAWLLSLHGHDESFARWMIEYGRMDFRHAVVAHATFLLVQALDLDVNYENHILWHELNLSLHSNAILREQPQITTGTIVTPYVAACYENIQWASYLRTMPIPVHHDLFSERSPESSISQGSQKLLLFSKYNCKSHSGLRLGDVIAVNKDVDTPWKGPEDLWYALLQDIQPLEDRVRLFVIWLYRPQDTICSDSKYPHNKELFLSDHCNCQDSVLDTNDVVKKVDIAFFSSCVRNRAEFFVRQTYFTGEETFVSLEKTHFSCKCRKEPQRERYEVGNTVLVVKSTILEPAVVIAINEDRVVLRFFKRISHDQPNRLTYTEDLEELPLSRIERRCHIRVFSTDSTIPTPYDRGGTGDHFYIIEPCDDDDATKHPQKASFAQGYDPCTPRRKLKALNLFSGGGNFDRGLADGGAIESKWAVEWDVHAISTYRANAPPTPDQELKLFCGSVNDYLAQAISGQVDDLIARPGEVDIISAGSPCQGYSRINQAKGNEKSLKNSSMIASVASFVDFYRPKYAILENVIAMATDSHGQNPLCQLICTFVGMGYQLRLLNMDAWSFGAPQKRSRIILMIAAPGLALPQRPPNTHSHPKKQQSRSTLGKTLSGFPFGIRHFEPPVFPYVRAAEVSKNLPSIGHARVMSIPYPDHRTSISKSLHKHDIVYNVPKYPKGMGLLQAVSMGNIDCPSMRRSSSGFSVAWKRIDPDDLIPTITTCPRPDCIYQGTIVHWKEDRVLTIQEARRAQGFPDSEVLIGSPATQWKIVGNSVSRHVALAIGLVIREACDINDRIPL